MAACLAAWQLFPWCDFAGPESTRHRPSLDIDALKQPSKEIPKMTETRLLTTVVGSYPQPEWLIDRQALARGSVPRIRASGLWRIPEEHLEAAQDDATLIAIRDLQDAGVDIISDGEIRRESYSNRFATALEGVDIDKPGQIAGSSGRPTLVPRVVGPIRRVRPVQVRDVQFLRQHTNRRIKVTVPGPFTMAQQAQNEYYPDRESLALDYACCVNDEVQALFAAGADVVQLDEPWLRVNPEEARKYGVTAINKALEGIPGVTALHLCFGYAAMVQGKPSRYAFLSELEDAVVQQISIEAAQPKLDLAVLQELPTKIIILGVLDLSDPRIETPESIAARLREALRYVPPERLMVAPDCGMKYLPREVAYRKLRAMTLAAAIVRESLG
jgi:5-methyltetrahydropteroyltriglutamate--homocysteine methyltransferase